MANDRNRKVQEREALRNVIVQWNANRLDLFEISEPNEDLEFHGVMRFYFQDAGQKVATKCIRVSSTATSQDVIRILIEKFRPDIRMLSFPEYAVYEIHENGDERKLGEEEKPLLVQLNWHKDDREGRFLLRRMDEKSNLPSVSLEGNSFRRKLSKREKREKKKREKREKVQSQENDEEGGDGIAGRLYSELPETSFTRSISNPEAVMRRRRQQKLERRLQQFRQEGGPDGGGTLRIFGEALNRDVPYKTLLLSTKDTAAFVVKEILEKYGHSKEDSSQYCLVQILLPLSASADLQDYNCSSLGIREYILDDDECPLAIEHYHNKAKGSIQFHIRRRPADYQLRKKKKKSKTARGESENSIRCDDSAERLPHLLELNPDGSEIQHDTPKHHRLYLNVTEVGCEKSGSTGGQHLQLFGPSVQPRHCVIAHTEGIVTVTPSSRDAETYVNGIRIYETTILQHGMIVRFGKLHTFRFVDPMQEERRHALHPSRQSLDYVDRGARKDEMQLAHQRSGFETTFDADGNIETTSTHSKDDGMSRKSDDNQSRRSFSQDGSQGRASYERYDQRRGNDPILPAVLEFWEEGEDAFLGTVISHVDVAHVQFKLAPTYTLYMAARYRASTHYRPDTTPNDRAHRLTTVMNRVATVIHQVIQDCYREAASLAFWLANASELLHFLKQDRHLSAYTLDAQDVLAESVQLAFRSLVSCQQVELQASMPAFLDDREDINEEEGATSDVLVVLSGAMSLLRRCRVNAALTIQLFSQLFHYINMWLFNHVMSSSRPNLCTRLWGVRLKRRLARVEAWAEKQGLELAADCHLSRIVQAAHLLQAPKSSPDDIASISSSCFKLNSLQLKTLLDRYQPAPDEPGVPPDLVDTVVKVAENTADELARSDGREIRLEEDPDLQLPFLLPEDGYSCDIVRGVPAGLQEFLQPLIQSGICRLSIQPTSSGYWTIYMSDQDIGHPPPMNRSPSGHTQPGDGEPAAGSGPGEPEVASIKLKKSSNGMGLSIVAARGLGQDRLGIYIKSVVKGGAADMDGQLQAGDQLLKVDGQSLVGVSQEKAADLMTRTGPLVTLEVAKQGAMYHGLAALLSQPSPVMQRGGSHPGLRRMSERDIPNKFVREPDRKMPLGSGMPMSVRIQGSKSVPALNSREAVHPMQNGNAIPQELYNPGYSRTSSTASIPKSVEGGAADGHRPGALGTQREDLHYAYRPQSAQSGRDQSPSFNRPVAQPYQHQGGQEERHYQNIRLYQQQNAIPGRTSPQPYPQRPLHGSHTSLQRAEPQLGPPHPLPDKSRPLSTLVSQRDHDHYINSFPYPARPYSSASVKPHYIQDGSNLSASYGHMPQEGREFANSSFTYHDGEGRPTEGPHPRLHPGQYSAAADARRRDILRQEAKMEEMHEEVRRREERERMLYLEQAASQVPGMQLHHQASGRPLPPSASAGPPVTAPKPQRHDAGHPPVQYHDAPGVHPSVQAAIQQQNFYGQHAPPQPAVSYRYGPSGYPPRPTDSQDQRQQTVPHGRPHGQSAQGERTAFDPSKTAASGQEQRDETNLMSPSPWVREEKEKQRQQRLEEARKARDDEVNELENLSHRSAKQDERLRTLRLEQEFQRRAAEVPGDEEEDDDEELMDRAENRERMLKMQEDMERARQFRLEREQQKQRQQQGTSAQDDTLRRHHERQRSQLDVLQEREGRLRQLRLEEVNRTHELEVAREAEEKLLREARRRQEEDVARVQHRFAHQQQRYGLQGSQPHLPAGMQLGGEPVLSRPPQQHRDVPPPLPTSPPPTEPSFAQQAGSTTLPRPDGTSCRPPVPPERKSSYEATNQLSASVHHGGQGAATRNGDVHLQVPKKVSFHDGHVQMDAYDANGNRDGTEVPSANASKTYTLQDIDEVLSPASMQNVQNANRYAVASTPGVIGAQEVYRDPRQRIEAERLMQQREHHYQRNVGPEKLSFREKMKMFALETGEDITPKDKVKISRAQRDIESNFNGT